MGYAISPSLRLDDLTESIVRRLRQRRAHPDDRAETGSDRLRRVIKTVTNEDILDRAELILRTASKA